MKNTDKVTLTVGQLKKLIKEEFGNIYIILESHKLDGAIERYGNACSVFGKSSNEALKIREEINKMIDTAPEYKNIEINQD